MKVLGKVQKKKKKKIESFKLDMRASAAAALAHTPCSHQHNVVDHSFLLAVPRVARRHVKDRVSNWRASSSNSSSSVTKRVTASRLEAIAGPWYFFQTCCAPFVENARSSFAGRYGRTTYLRLQKHWKRKRESPGEINVEGFGQDR